MRRKPIALPLGIAAMLLALASPAAAVCKLDVTLTQYYDRMNVLLGTVEGIQPEARLVIVKVSEALKGESPGPRLRVQIASPAEMIKNVAAGQPIVLFLSRGQGAAAVHMADTWVLASAVPGANPPAWRVVQLKDDLKPAFPGRTESLVRLLKELKAGRRPTIDRWDHKPFAAGAKQRARLDVQKPAWLLAADVNGDKKPDLLVGSATGVRLFLATAGGYEDATATWGLGGAAGGYHAAADADGDGHADLLLDDTLWLSDGKKFTAKTHFELPKNGRPLGAALVDVTGDGKPDAVYLSSTGELRVFENPGSAGASWRARPAKTLDDFVQSPVAAAFGGFGETGNSQVVVFGENQIVRYALDAEGGPPADLGRLTGVDLRKSPRFGEGLKCRAGLAIQMDADQRCDLLALCDRGAVLLVNRGFGFFFLDDNPMAAVTPPRGLPAPIRAAPGMVCAAADLGGHGYDDLLVLTEDGTLFEFDNSP